MRARRRWQPCLGPLTQAGCGAICPAYGRACYACFGPREQANVPSLHGWFARIASSSRWTACSPASTPGPRRSASPRARAVRAATGGRSRCTETEEVEVDVGQLTRVEGEGRLSLTVREGLVTKAHLEIFEAPRYFERLVVGRTPDEVIDIVARICGICPVAYQMSAVHAFEGLFGVAIDPEIRRLRRLFYCGEWIESHALHIYLLHAPDFLGYPSAVELAADHPDVVERGLRIKRLGNRIVAILGGRPIHPVSVRVGGFSRAPRTAELDEIRRVLPGAIDEAHETVRWAASLAPPPYAASRGSSACAMPTSTR